MRRLTTALGLGALLVGASTGCATLKSKMEDLSPAVKSYAELLRWKKFDRAAQFVDIERRSQFLEQYLTAEDDLYVDSIEVRAMEFAPASKDEPLRATVTLVAQAYLLPSTVLEKIIVTQTWEDQGGAWQIIETNRELVPNVEPRVEPEPAAPSAYGP